MDQVPAGVDESATASKRRGRKRRSRPAFALVVGLTIALRLGREVIGRVLWTRFGVWGLLLLPVVVVAVMLGWRAVQRHRVRRRGGEEFTPEMIRDQVALSGIGRPAFGDDGSLLGSSVLAVNQRAKLLEIDTAYDVFGAGGQRLGTVRQIGQSRAKQAARVLTAFDQYFTHHFDVADSDGCVVLRLTRPRKVFRTKVHVFDGADRFLGSIVQRNVFGKIRFEIVAASGQQIGTLRALNLRAWDFELVDVDGAPLASLFKSWEGFAHTAFTRADRYVVRIERPLIEPARSLTFAAALTIDLALKQDARGFG